MRSDKTEQKSALKTGNSKPKSARKPRKKKSVLKGHALYDQLVKLTGIPSQAIQRELTAIFEKKNIDIRHLTMEQLRVVVASYVREIMGGLIDRYTPRRTDSH